MEGRGHEVRHGLLPPGWGLNRGSYLCPLCSDFSLRPGPRQLLLCHHLLRFCPCSCPGAFISTASSTRWTPCFPTGRRTSGSLIMQDPPMWAVSASWGRSSTSSSLASFSACYTGQKALTVEAFATAALGFVLSRTMSGMSLVTSGISAGNGPGLYLPEVRRPEERAGHSDH